MLISKSHGPATSDKEILEALFNSVDLIPSFTLPEVQEHISLFKNFRASFDADYAGERANQAYEKFLILCDGDSPQNALKYYYIAKYFKAAFLSRRISDTREILRKAFQYYRDEKYEQALEQVNDLNIVSQNNRALMDLKDSLKMVRKYSRNGLKYLQRQHNHWRQTGTKSYHFSLAAGPNLFYQQAVSDEWVPVENSSKTYKDIIMESDLTGIMVNNTQPRLRAGISLIGSLRIKSRIVLGLNFSYGIFEFSSGRNNTALADLVFYDFKFRSYASQVYLKYLFRDNPGFRPYLNLGFADSRFRREESEAGKFEIWGSTESGIVPAKSFGNSGIYLGFGMEYISGLSSRIVLGQQVSFIRYFDRMSFIKQNQISISAYIGFLL
ncbi:MAG: hypothetical protein P8184_18945 [Calditrichia bacterium]